jgi:hypothetical protein
MFMFIGFEGGNQFPIFGFHLVDAFEVRLFHLFSYPSAGPYQPRRTSLLRSAPLLTLSAPFNTPVGTEFLAVDFYFRGRILLVDQDTAVAAFDVTFDIEPVFRKFHLQFLVYP